MEIETDVLLIFNGDEKNVSIFWLWFEKSSECEDSDKGESTFCSHKILPSTIKRNCSSDRSNGKTFHWFFPKSNPKFSSILYSTHFFDHELAIIFSFDFSVQEKGERKCFWSIVITTSSTCLFLSFIDFHVFSIQSSALLFSINQNWKPKKIQQSENPIISDAIWNCHKSEQSI